MESRVRLGFTRSFSKPGASALSGFLPLRTLTLRTPLFLKKHLPWRTRLAVATCYAFEDAGKPEASAKCANHALEKVDPHFQRFPSVNASCCEHRSPS